MIVVTGGTGRVGRQVVAQLTERGRPVRVVSRNSRNSAEAGHADLADPVTLEPHLRDAEALFLLWPFTSAEITADLAPRVAKIATVREVTGAPARSFADWAAANADAFR
jgi:uncharacterized protein YbjT (DUF2867 family)